MVAFDRFILVVPILALAASITYYAMVLRNQNQTRQAQLFMELYKTYRDPVFREQFSEILLQEWRDFEDFWDKYGQQNNPEAWARWQTVVSYFQGIGVLLRQGMLDIKVIEELFAPTVFIAWVRMGPIVKGFKELSKTDSHRAQYNDLEGEGLPKKWDPWSGFEYLFNELKKRDRQNPNR